MSHYSKNVKLRLSIFLGVRITSIVSIAFLHDLQAPADQLTVSRETGSQRFWCHSECSSPNSGLYCLSSLFFYVVKAVHVKAALYVFTGSIIRFKVIPHSENQFDPEFGKKTRQLCCLDVIVIAGGNVVPQVMVASMWL